MFETLWQDVVYGLRVFRRSPGFVFVACASLAIGIGANAAVFSVLRASQWDRLPVHEPSRLALFNWVANRTPSGSAHNGWTTTTVDGLRTSTSYPYPAFARFRDNRAFSHLFAFAPIYRLNLSIDGRAELATGILVTGDYFAGLGLSSELGRTVSEEDDAVGAAPSVVLAFGFWMRRFGGSPDVIGQPIKLNGTDFTVIGIAPRGFQGTLQVGSDPAVFVPMAQSDLVTLRLGARDDLRLWWIQIMGRLSPGVSFAEAQAEMEVVWNQVVLGEWSEEELRRVSVDGRIASVPKLTLSSGDKGMHEVRAEMALPLLITFAVTGLTLLIACVNLANLLLARGGRRRQEMALRHSMGAERGRLIRQLLTESLMLSMLGTLGGLAVAFWGTEAILGLVPHSRDSALSLDIGIDRGVLAFAVGMTVVTSLFFGLIPALRGSRLELASSVKTGYASAGGSRSWIALSRALVVAQVAMSLTLVIVAGLFSKSLGNLERIDPGFNAARVLVFRIDPTLNGYHGARLAALYRDIQERIHVLPEVRSVTISPFSLLAGAGSWSSVSVLGATSTNDEARRVHVHAVSDNFLKTMEIPLVAGRDLASPDTANAPRVAVINQTFARAFFGTGDPVGSLFAFGEGETSPNIEIVGVARDAKNESLRREILPTVYIPYVQRERLRSMTFSIRTRGEPAAIAGLVREVVRQVDADVPVFELTSMEQQIADGLSQERRFAHASVLFGFIGLVLACLGLYGVLSHALAQRAREFGVRLALGATRQDVTKLVMREMSLVLAGIGLGIVAGLLGARITASLLFGISANDPVTIVFASLLMFAIAGIATFVPAQKASRTDPATVLRVQ